MENITKNQKFRIANWVWGFFVVCLSVLVGSFQFK